MGFKTIYLKMDFVFLLQPVYSILHKLKHIFGQFILIIVGSEVVYNHKVQ